MSRPRQTGSKDLPPNLYFRKARDSFYYRRPIDGKRISFTGLTRAEAIESAKTLNAEFVPQQHNQRMSIARAMGHGIFSDHLEWMREFYKNKVGKGSRPRSPKTFQNDCNYLNHIGRSNMADMIVADIKPKYINEFLFSVTDSQYTGYRSKLNQIFEQAILKGMIEVNPVDAVPTSIDYEKQRNRLSLDAYMKIRECASPYMQNLFDFSLTTLMSEIDVCKLPRKLYVEDGKEYLRYTRTKVEHHKNVEGNAQIEISPPIKEMIVKARDDILSDYLFHFTTENRRNKWGQPLNRAHLTRKFDEARKKAMEKYDLFSDWSGYELPSFAEIRSLGTYLYKEHYGVLPKELMAHADKSMTESYVEGHKDEEYTLITYANLDLTKVRKLEGC